MESGGDQRAGVADNDTDDLEALFAREYPALRKLAFVLVGDRELAEDLVQSAFTSLLRQRHEVEAPAPYLRRCVANAAKTHYRWSSVRRRAILPVPAGVEPAGHDEVIDAIRRLPHRQRAVIVLRYYAQFTDPEIADTLDLPLGTAKSTIRRALDTLRKELP